MTAKQYREAIAPPTSSYGSHPYRFLWTPERENAMTMISINQLSVDHIKLANQKCRKVYDDFVKNHGSEMNEDEKATLWGLCVAAAAANVQTWANP